MTATTHVYTATVAGTPLSVRGGSVTLDAGTAPHVQGAIEVGFPGAWTIEPDVVTGGVITSYGGPKWTPDPATYALLDPRSSPAPRVIITASAGIPRTFNLHVRGRLLNESEGTVSLTLASDEGLLQDYGLLSDDRGPLAFTYQPPTSGGGLARVVNYVLNKAIPGTALASLAVNPAIRALSPATNLIPNSRAAVASTDLMATWTSGGLTQTRYTTGGPSYAPSYMGQQAGAGGAAGAYMYVAEAALNVSPGRLYVLSADMRAYGVRQMVLGAILYDASGKIIAYATPRNVTPAGAWVRTFITFYGPSGVAKVRPIVTPLGGLAGSEFTGVTAWRLTESTGDRIADAEYIAGDTADTAEYHYAFADVPHESISTQTPLIDAPVPDALIWKVGQSALDFLQPLLQAQGLRLVCDETRTWTLRDATYTVSGSTSISAGATMVDGSENVSRDNGEWFDARTIVYSWPDPATGVRQRRTDTYALTGYTRLTHLELSNPYSGPGRAQYAVERAQGRGRAVTATAVSDWSTRTEQAVTVDFTQTPSLTGVVQSVEFNFDTDEMTVTARTVGA